MDTRDAGVNQPNPTQSIPPHGTTMAATGVTATSGLSEQLPPLQQTSTVEQTLGPQSDRVLHSQDPTGLVNRQGALRRSSILDRLDGRLLRGSQATASGDNSGEYDHHLHTHHQDAGLHSSGQQSVGHTQVLAQLSQHPSVQEGAMAGAQAMAALCSSSNCSAEPDNAHSQWTGVGGSSSQVGAAEATADEFTGCRVMSEAAGAAVTREADSLLENSAVAMGKLRVRPPKLRSHVRLSGGPNVFTNLVQCLLTVVDMHSMLLSSTCDKENQLRGNGHAEQTATCCVCANP